MSVFNLFVQNANLDNKIVAGLERLSQVFRVLLWEKAKEQGLSPIQIQLLIFIQYHAKTRATVSYLAAEFNLTKPTISDAVKVLEQKSLIKKVVAGKDNRSYTIVLTAAGRKAVEGTEDFAAPLTGVVQQIGAEEKLILWKQISGLILQLNRLGIISTQRMCFNCKHYAGDGKTHFCTLLRVELETQHIRIDCPEFAEDAVPA